MPVPAPGLPWSRHPPLDEKGHECIDSLRERCAFVLPEADVDARALAEAPPVPGEIAGEQQADKIRLAQFRKLDLVERCWVAEVRDETEG